MRAFNSILVTGGAGFIGSHFIRMLVNDNQELKVINLDALTYAGNLENLKDVEDHDNYTFVKGSINDAKLLNKIFEQERIDCVVNLAAESHVDKSIEDPLKFVRTNLLGTTTLLHACKINWKNNLDGKLFYHVSTDEVYGSLAVDNSLFSESTPYDPRSPYSASKAGSDHMVRAYFHTYKLPAIISNCSNNYGPNQYPEKVIPLFANNILNNQQLPVYGKGENVRDWLYVEDHCKAINLIMHEGNVGETYNIGGENEWKNIDLIHNICDMMDVKLKRPFGSSRQLITFVEDRKGHDLRYAIDNSKLKNELGWKAEFNFNEALSYTLDWYLKNNDWIKKVTSGDYMNYYNKQYN